MADAADDRLRLLIERIERLEEEKKGIADDIKDVYAEAKAVGYDAKIMRQIIRLRKMTVEDRREQQALLDVYKASLGMLDGTPLGRWAIERITKKDRAPQDEIDATDSVDDAGDAPAEQSREPEPDVDQARALGAAAAREGKPVTANPFPARDLRRAAWDEAWCQALGSDGMDIPDAWRPTKKAPEKASEKEAAE